MSATTASRSTTVSRVYLIIALFVALIFCLVLLIQVQMDALAAIRAYVGGEGLWAKAQKDAVLSLEHYAISRDEADYLAYQRQIQVPLGDEKARIELQKPNPDMAIVRAGFLQGRNHPDDVDSAARFFRRFQQTAYMAQVIVHWTAADRLIAELNGVAEKIHGEIASGRASPRTIRAIHARLEDLNRQVTVEEDLFSSTLAEASRWANDVARNLTYTIAFLFAVLGVTLSWPIIARIRITERSLFESEQKFRSITTSAMDAIAMIDDEGKTVFFNAAAEKMFGYSAHEIIGKEMHSLIAQPRYLEGYRHAFPRFAKSGEGAAIGKVVELGALRKDGSEFPIELSVSAIRIKGRWTAVGIIRDISERKTAENVLAESEMKLRTILESLQTGIVIIDPEAHKITYVNPVAARMIGAPKEKIINANCHQFICPAEWGKCPITDLHQTVDNSERVLLTATGEKCPIIKTVTTILLGGKEFLLESFIDITERKQAEEALRVSALKHQLLFESSRDALMTLAPPSWKFTAANQATLQLFGAASVAEFTALGPWNVSPERQPDGRLSGEKAQEMIAIAMREGAHYFEWEHQRLGGQPFATDVLLTRMTIGADIFLQATVRDITERKLAEERIKHLNEELESKVQKRTGQLLQAQEELVRKEKLALLGQVAGSVGHELRNPLGVMSNAVYFLQTVLSDADETTREYLGIIRNEIVVADRIVGDLLDSVRTQPPQPQKVAVADLIAQTLLKCKVPTTVTTRQDIPDTLPFLWVDPLQVGQVFRNLVSNGVEAMAQVGTLEIRAVENRQDGSVSVSVQDSGSGIAPEQLGKLFQPLYTTKARGIGLGLVVVKNLTQANGGKVEVASEPGKGATFTITLPSAAVQAETE